MSVTGPFPSKTPPFFVNSDPASVQKFMCLTPAVINPLETGLPAQSMIFSDPPRTSNNFVPVAHCQKRTVWLLSLAVDIRSSPSPLNASVVTAIESGPFVNYLTSVQVLASQTMIAGSFPTSPVATRGCVGCTARAVTSSVCPWRLWKSFPPKKR